MGGALQEVLGVCGEVFPDVGTFSPQGFSRIAQAYNCFRIRVEEPGELEDALRAALASGQLAVMDVVIDPEDSDWGERGPWRSYQGGNQRGAFGWVNRS